MMRVVGLLSGGLDSSTSASLAKSEGYGTFALHLNCGQRTPVRPGALAVAGNHDNVENGV